MAKVKISITIDEEVLVNVKAAAQKDKRTLSQFINKVLEEHNNANKDA